MSGGGKYEAIIKYEKSRDRWADGVRHHPKSLEIIKFIQEIDFHVYGDHFGWTWGGDGDNGETLMHQLDAYFEQLEREGVSTDE